MANLGQLKHFASKAAAELNGRLPGGAGPGINNLVASWSQPPAIGVDRNDYAAVTIGQLKAVATLFYDRLIAADYTGGFPWTVATEDDDNYAVANLGQLKQVFSFDLSNFNPHPDDVDNNGVGDGLPDAWEQQIVDANPDDAIANADDVFPGDDFDGDGASNLAEYQNGTDPTNPDSDGDWLLDGWEIAHGLDPLNPDADNDGIYDRDEDPDGDGLVNFWEWFLGRDPNNAHTVDTLLDDSHIDTDGDGMTDGEEINFGFDLFMPENAFEDADGDGYPNLAEIRRGTLPKEATSQPAPDIVVYPPSTATPHPVQDAIDNLAAQGIDYGVIQLTAGNYPENLRITLRPVILIGVGSHPGASIDGQGADRVLDIECDTVLIGLRIINGQNDFGGGLHALFCRVRATNCIFQNNYAFVGGAIDLQESQGWLQNCTLFQNAASFSGSGADLSGPNARLRVDASVLWNEPNAFLPLSEISSEVAENATVTRCDIRGGFGEESDANFDTDPILNLNGRIIVYSSCINAFTATPQSPVRDIDGELRNDGFPDIGADEYRDDDNTFLPDSWEAKFPAGSLGAWNDDPDKDRRKNFDEYQLGSYPLFIDDDGDGLSNDFEVLAALASSTSNAKFDPMKKDSDGDGIDDGDEDFDGDGLSNAFEATHGYDPTLADTDHNGIDDGYEDYDLDGIRNIDASIAKRYVVVDIAPSGNGVYKLTNSGFALMYARQGPARWQGGSMTYLSGVGPGWDVSANDINESGSVVGSVSLDYDDDQRVSYAAFWSSGQSFASQSSLPNDLSSYSWYSTINDTESIGGNTFDYYLTLDFHRIVSGYVNGVRLSSPGLPIGLSQERPIGNTSRTIYSLNNRGQWYGHAEDWIFSWNGHYGYANVPYDIIATGGYSSFNSIFELPFSPSDMNDDGFAVGFSPGGHGYYFDATTSGDKEPHILFYSMAFYGYRLAAVNNRQTFSAASGSMESDYQLLASGSQDSILWEKPRNYDGPSQSISYLPTRVSSLVFNNQWASIRGTDINDAGIICANAQKMSDGKIYPVLLLPIEMAPDVLAVNSNFDEGRIDSTTGYPIPDCDDMSGVDPETGAGNTLVRIDAERAHLDQRFANDERVTEEMHKGWFGANPNLLGDEFWDGATVTIRKLDKTDPDTGEKETGQVRFYAKWGDKFGPYYGITPYDLETLEPTNLVTGGINGRPGEGVYGSTSTIPEDAQFWMEGIRPGKITLEWRLKKGSIDVKHEQTFLVETRLTPDQWKRDLAYKIRLDTANDASGQIDVFVDPRAVESDYWTTVERMSEYYDYYRENYLTDDDFQWSGMARLAGSQVISGISDAKYAYNTAGALSSPFGPWVDFVGVLSARTITSQLIDAEMGATTFLIRWLGSTMHIVVRELVR